MNRKFKLFISLIAIIVFIFSLTACDTGNILPEPTPSATNGNENNGPTPSPTQGTDNGGGNEDEEDFSALADFVIDIEEGKEIKILVLADTQIIDAGQMRTPQRLGSTQQQMWATDTIYDNCFKYIAHAVNSTQPDLILIVGDIIYGEFDDSGAALLKVVEHMESYKIPWAPVFGNHDNESLKGVEWQVQQFLNAEYCLFKRGDVTGNGNYTIALTQGGKLARMVYMMDSNGCHSSTDPSVKKTRGFGNDQKQWIIDNATLIEETLERQIPSFIALHIPTIEFLHAAIEAGYQPQADTSSQDFYSYKIGIDVEAKNGDFGTKNEHFKDIHNEEGFLDILKAHNFDGVFVGHNHRNNTSVLYESIRWTFTLKTGTYDRFNPGELGGTLIEVASGGETFTVEHVYYEGPEALFDAIPNQLILNEKGLLFTNNNTGSVAFARAQSVFEMSGYAEVVFSLQQLQDPSAEANFKEVWIEFTNGSDAVWVKLICYNAPGTQGNYMAFASVLTYKEDKATQIAVQENINLNFNFNNSVDVSDINVKIVYNPAENKVSIGKEGTTLTDFNLTEHDIPVGNYNLWTSVNHGGMIIKEINAFSFSDYFDLDLFLEGLN